MSKRGGRRPGAGRPPRPDGRRWRVVKVPLTDDEFLSVKAIAPDDRREALLGLVSWYGQISETEGNTENSSPWGESVLIKAKRPRPSSKAKRIPPDERRTILMTATRVLSSGRRQEILQRVKSNGVRHEDGLGGLRLLVPGLLGEGE